MISTKLQVLTNMLDARIEYFAKKVRQSLRALNSSCIPHAQYVTLEFTTMSENKITDKEVLVGIILKYPEFLEKWELIKNCMPKNKMLYEMGLKIEDEDIFIAALGYASAMNTFKNEETK